jgi:hypothetical protein
MEHDGYQVTDASHINSTGALPWLPPEALANLRNPKELIESTAQTVLAELGLTWNEREDDLPVLVGKAQKALKLDPAFASAGQDGSDGVKRILGASLTIVGGLGELGNRYGTGHGRHGMSGLRPRQ